MPSRWEITLAGPAGAPIPLTAPTAVLAHWLDDPPARHPQARPPGGGRSGHNDQARKWTWGPLRASPPATSEADATIVLGVRLLDDALSGRLRAAVQPGRDVRLGGDHYTISEPPCLIERVTWQGLRRQPGTRAWQVRFVTPVCLRRGSSTSPWPAPQSVARGLADRWQRLDPDTAPTPSERSMSAVWVSDIEGRSEVQILTRNVRRGGQWHLEEEVISGFTGRIRYVCDHGKDTEAADFNALMAFALFAGIGSHTTYGFGAVAREPTWQPRTMRPGPP